jgi:hypothetical protein
VALRRCRWAGTLAAFPTCQLRECGWRRLGSFSCCWTLSSEAANATNEAPAFGEGAGKGSEPRLLADLQKCSFGHICAIPGKMPNPSVNVLAEAGTVRRPQRQPFQHRAQRKTRAGAELSHMWSSWVGPIREVKQGGAAVDGGRSAVGTFLDLRAKEVIFSIRSFLISRVNRGKIPKEKSPPFPHRAPCHRCPTPCCRRSS